MKIKVVNETLSILMFQSNLNVYIESICMFQSMDVSLSFAT